MKLEEIKPVAYEIDYTQQGIPVFFQKELVYDLKAKTENVGITNPLYTAKQMKKIRDESIRDIFEKYNIFDVEGRRMQLGDLIKEDQA